MQFTHMHYNLRKHFFSNRILQYGIVFLSLLLKHGVLAYLKIVWIDSRLIKNLNLTGMLTLLELEAKV